MKGIATCGVCGRDFALVEEEHYIARDGRKTGIVPAIESEEEKLYDAYDCPHCGCQYIAQQRKASAELDDIEENETEEAEEYDGCEGCVHKDKPASEEPCNQCVRSCLDYYEREDKK